MFTTHFDLWPSKTIDKKIFMSASACASSLIVICQNLIQFVVKYTVHCVTLNWFIGIDKKK